MKKNLLILFTLFLSVIGQSQTFVDNFITYKVTSTTLNTVEATSYNTAGGSIVDIPATVKYNNAKYTVTSIGVVAFNNKNLTSVVIPKSIISLGSSSFSSNLSLSSVTLPNSVTILGDNAFRDTGLTSVNIPNTLTSIGKGTFLNAGLTTVTIPASVVTIGEGAFASNNLMNIIIPDNVTNIGNFAFRFNNLTNVIIPNSVTSLGFLAFNSNNLTNVVIGSNVASIGYGAFGYNNSLVSITALNTTPATINTTGNISDDTFGYFRSNIDLEIPFGTTAIYNSAEWTGFNSVNENVSVGNVLAIDYISYEVSSIVDNTVKVIDYDMAGGGSVVIPSSIDYSNVTYDVIGIDDFSFANKQITSVTIPNSIVSIGEQSFRNNLLSNVTIPNSVTTIGEFAFNQNQLTSVTISESLSIINLATFSSNQLTSVIIPNSVSTIGINAFQGNLIANVIIPNNVTDLGVGAFENNKLVSVTISQSLTSLNSNVFSGNLLTAVVIPNNITLIDLGVFQNNDLTSVDIPESVTTIGIAAFINNQLTEITIPVNVTSIGNQAFKGNPLNTVTSKSIIPPTITTGGSFDTFIEDRSGIHLYIPASTMGVYVTDAGALWTNFNPVTEDTGVHTFDFGLANDIKVLTTEDAIKITHSNKIRLQNYTIYSISGHKISSGIENTISASFLNPGFYIIDFEFDKGSFVHKISIN